MAILRCKSCGLLREVPSKYAGKKVKCPSCQQVIQIHDTLILVKKLFEMLSQLQKEVVSLKQNSSQPVAKSTPPPPPKPIAKTNSPAKPASAPNLPPSSPTPFQQPGKEVVSLKQNSSQPVAKSNPSPPSKPVVKQSTPPPPPKPIAKTNSPAKPASAPNLPPSSPTPFQQPGYAFANLDSAPAFRNVEPAIKWFQAKQINTKLDEKSMDISGFFDEIAVMVGDNYSSLKELLDRIKRTQRKGYPKFTLDISAYSQKDVDIISKFCREAYKSSFIGRFVNRYEGNKNLIHLTLQTEPKIVNFFNGFWFEWFVLMKVATILVERKIEFSCLRSAKITFANKEQHEIDLFFLINGLPLWIECKTGEFRDSIAKYSKLRKQLKIDKERSLLMVLDLTEEKIAGLTSMYDITFVSEKTLGSYLEKLLPAPSTTSSTPAKRDLFSLWKG